MLGFMSEAHNQGCDPGLGLVVVVLTLWFSSGLCGVSSGFQAQAFWARVMVTGCRLGVS